MKVRTSVPLNNGSTIPAKYCAVVSGVDVLEGVPVVQITAPAGTTHWIAKSNVLPV